MQLKMRCLLLSTALSFGTGSASLAADLPPKPPAPAAAPALQYSWSGFYLGGNVGYSVGVLRHSETRTFFLGNNAGLVDPASTDRAVQGVIGGGQIGWNWQATPNWLFGIEADIQGSGQKGSNSSITNTNETVGTTTVVQTLAVESEHKLKWFGTVRGRAGFIVGNTLLYGTGGYAYGKVDFSESENRAPAVPGRNAFSGTASVSETRQGWTAGAGAETRLIGNWTAKIEYLFVDLGTADNVFPVRFTSGPNVGAVQSNVLTSSRFQDHIFRAGLNFKFGG